jgi:hypothetical protein
LLLYRLHVMITAQYHQQVSYHGGFALVVKLHYVARRGG